MRMRSSFLLLACLALITMAGCSSQEERNRFEQQKYYFIESMQQVESGGRQLQEAALDRVALEQALDSLERGLKLAFEVDRDFLDKLDLRLGKNYQRYFIEGVQSYRIGIEAGDQAQQQEGVELLQKFWQQESASIQAALHPQ